MQDASCQLTITAESAYVHVVSDGLFAQASDGCLSAYFWATWAIELGPPPIGFPAPGMSWTVVVSNCSDEPLPVSGVAIWTPSPGIAQSGLPWRIIEASASQDDLTRTETRNNTTNVGNRIEFDGQPATVAWELFDATIAPGGTVWLHGAIGNCLLEDLDGSGSIDAGDIGILIGDWGASGGRSDLDGNGVVGSSDLAWLLAAM